MLSPRGPFKFQSIQITNKSSKRHEQKISNGGDSLSNSKLYRSCSGVEKVHSELQLPLSNVNLHYPNLKNPIII